MTTFRQSDIVRLEIPPDGAYVAVLRSVVGNIAGRNDFTVDEIDDLRIAVDEACALLLPQAHASIVTEFRIEPPDLVVAVTAPTEPGWEPDTASVGWTLLDALVDDLRIAREDAWISITITARASLATDVHDGVDDHADDPTTTG